MTQGLPPTTVARVLLDHCPAQPWRNGGGLTRELLVWRAPHHAPSPDSPWSLRLSVADITQDGPFSSFPGIDRCFAVLEGNGVELALPAGARQQRLTDPPLAFDGAVAVGCRLLGGPTRDLNLMGQRSAGRIAMQRALPESVLEAGSAWRGLFAFSAAQVDCGPAAGLQTLDPGTLLWSDHPHAGRWRLTHGSHAFWLALFARDTSP